MRKALLIIAGILLLTGMQAEAGIKAKVKFSGIVYNDANRDGVRGEDEEGLAGVAVTDGFSVVLTNRKGQYKITPNPRARFITVCTPDGYANSNRFFSDVRERMSGQKIEGEILSRPNPGLDFGLYKSEKFGKFVHMSDIEDRVYMDWIDRMKEYSETHDIDFVAITGDICYESGLLFFAKAMTDENMGRRVVYTIGNHDLIRGSKDYLGNDYGEKNFENSFGPSWYSFTASGVHFIVTPMLMGDAKPSYSADDIKAWIQEDIKTIPDGMPIMMFNHDAAEKLIPENANVRAFVYGHRHDDFRTVRESGITFYCSMAPSKASNDHSASAIREFTFNDKGDVRTRMHYGPLSNHVVAHCVNGKVSAVIYDAASEAVKAEILLPDGPRIEMRQTNDMIWEGILPEMMTEGQVYHICAEFADGEKVVSRQLCESGLKWLTTLPCKTFFTDPIISNGHLFIAGMDNENGTDCAVFSLNSENGNIEWKMPVRNSVKGDMTLMDGVLYASDVDYNVYAIDAATGKLKWTRRIAQIFYPSFTEGLYASDGRVYAGCADNLCALDAETGEILWTNTHKHGSITNICTNRTVAGALLTNGYWVGRFCYDAATGEFLWEKKDYDNRYSSCTPAVLDTTFIYTGYSSLFQVGARSGKVLKSGNYDHIFNTRSEPLVTGEKVFVGSSNDGLVAIDMKDMKQAWNFLCEPALIYTSPYTKNREKTVESSPAAFGGNVVFGANDGFVYCLRQDNGLFVWRLNIGLPVLCKPQIVGTRMYVTDFAGNVYCYQL